MTLPANIRVNIGAPFPSRVQGSAFISLSKANGIWTIAPNYTLLAASPAVTPTQELVVFDTATGVFSTLGAAALAAGGGNVYREVAAGGNVNVLPMDVVIILTGSPAATSIILPQSSLRAGASVTVKDLTGGANSDNITFVPASGETIDGFSASAAAANGLALLDVNYGKKTLFPLISGGWYL